MYNLIPVQGGYLTTVTGETVYSNPKAAVVAAEQQIAIWYGTLRRLQRDQSSSAVFAALALESA